MRKGFAKITVLFFLFVFLLAGCNMQSDIKRGSGAAQASDVLPLSFSGENSSYVIKPTQFTLKMDGSPSELPWFDVDLSYPQLVLMNDKAMQQKINVMLFDAAVQMLHDGSTASDLNGIAAAMIAEETDRIEGLCSADVGYEVLYFDAETLSLCFKGSVASGGVRVISDEYYVTIDLTSGDYIRLTERYTAQAVHQAISNGHYEVIEGDYLPGGWGDHFAMREEFAKAFETGLQYADAWRLERAPFSFGKYEVEYSGMDSESPEYFGMDSENIYVRFGFYDSLNGYCVLKIPKIELS